ncbi:hypothetical protein [Rhizobium phaseoli]|uniref:hypothetical protein n=1 Tax=Rhizobium phaseoli TaxID=396 RepID=UPI001FE241CC|nr:hypothetical protein [Rhizobium phaseoli]
MLIRAAVFSDFAALRFVELASFETPRNAGAVNGTPTASSDEELQHYLGHALLYVACDQEGSAVGYCGGYIAARFLHIGEMDVHPVGSERGWVGGFSQP